MAEHTTFDLSLIQDWTRSRQDTTPAGPYLATYHQDGKTLRYIAAHHESKNGLANPTLPLISDALNANPKAIIVETTPYQVQPGDILSNNEAQYAASLAEIKGIPWIPGEASNEEVFSHLEKQGYTHDDGAHFYMLRAMVDENSRHPSPDEHSLFQAVARSRPPVERPSETDFNRWFAEHNDTGKSILQMTNMDTAPTLANDPTYFNTISHHVSTAREQHLDQLIEKSLNQHGDVVVIYGKAHHLKSQQVLETALGEPQITEASFVIKAPTEHVLALPPVKISQEPGQRSCGK